MPLVPGILKNARRWTGDTGQKSKAQMCIPIIPIWRSVATPDQFVKNPAMRFPWPLGGAAAASGVSGGGAEAVCGVLAVIRDDRDFVVRLRPVPPGRDVLGREPAYRLKIALKRLWRAYGLRAVSVRTTPDGAERSAAEAHKLVTPAEGPRR